MPTTKETNSPKPLLLKPSYQTLPELASWLLDLEGDPLSVLELGSDQIHFETIRERLHWATCIEWCCEQLSTETVTCYIAAWLNAQSGDELARDLAKDDATAIFASLNEQQKETAVALIKNISSFVQRDHEGLANLKEGCKHVIELMEKMEDEIEPDFEQVNSVLAGLVGE